MFQEPFFLHPPGSRPRDGLYINPMSSPFQSGRQKDASPVTSNGSESFYLHSPHDVVYTRITHLFDDGGGGGGVAPVIAERASSVSSRSSIGERKDEPLTGKWSAASRERACAASIRDTYSARQALDKRSAR